MSDKPSSPLPGEHRTPSGDKLMATLSESGSPKLAEAARAEIAKALEDMRQEPGKEEETPSASILARKEAGREVTEAATKFTDGVDVITETLILILGKFKTLVWRTNVGMAFGAGVFIICLLVARQAQQAALLQEENARKVLVLAEKLNEALARLDKIQQSAVATEQKVDAVKDAKPSIEIVPDQNRPGEAKVVIRPNAVTAPPVAPPAPAPAAGYGAGYGSLGARKKAAGEAKQAAPEAPPPPVQSVLEIPLQLKNIEQRSAD